MSEYKDLISLLVEEKVKNIDKYKNVVQISQTPFLDLANNLLAHGWRLLEISSISSFHTTSSGTGQSSAPVYILGRPKSVKYTLEEAEQERQKKQAK